MADGKAGRLGYGAGTGSSTAEVQDSEAGISTAQIRASTSPNANQLVRKTLKGSSVFDALPTSRYSSDRGAQCLSEHLTCPVFLLSVV